MIRVQIDYDHTPQWDGLVFSDISRIAKSPPASCTGIEQFIIDVLESEYVHAFSVDTTQNFPATRRW